MKKCLFFVAWLLLVISALIGSGNFPTSINEIVIMFIPLVPLSWVHVLCYNLYWILSFYVFPLGDYLGIAKFEDCAQSDDNNLRVLVTTLKSGTILANAVGNELFRVCGFTASLSKPSNSSLWPDLRSGPPDYESDLFIALGNVMTWEEYLEYDFNRGKELRCAVLVRSPYSRLISLYKYTRDYGEKGLHAFAEEMGALKTTQERFDVLWNKVGKKVMKDSHTSVSTAIKKNCTRLHLDELMRSSSDYEKAMTDMLDAFEIKKGAYTKLLQEFSQHDLNRLTKEQKASNTHVSGRNLEEGELDELKKIVYSSKEVAELLRPQCDELGYACRRSN